MILGAYGQDGTYLSELLIRQGSEVVGVIRPGSSCKYVNSSVSYKFLDVLDIPALKNLIRETNPDVVINLASMSSVSACTAEPEKSYRINFEFVEELIAILLEIRNESRKDIRLIQASSSEMFGESNGHPLLESSPFRPKSVYGQHKLDAHLAITRARESKGLWTSSLLLFNHESPRRPQTFVSQKIASEAVKLYKGEIQYLRLGNLDIARDWGYAPDFVEAFSLVSKSENPNDYIVATNRLYSIRYYCEVVFAILGINNLDRFVVTDPSLVRSIEPISLRGDYSKIYIDLGWEPKHDFDYMIHQMIEHQLKIQL